MLMGKGSLQVTGNGRQQDQFHVEHPTSTHQLEPREACSVRDESSSPNPQRIPGEGVLGQLLLQKEQSFEWYGEYTDLCHILHTGYLKSSSRVLIVGCGNSKLREDLYDAGFQTIDNIDISDVVIRQMSVKNKQKRLTMTFTKMDLLHITYTDAQFDCVLDKIKGTLDAIFSNTDDKTLL